jgi:DeoR/GlpR family transcriptional regulator of sugar metabolism
MSSEAEGRRALIAELAAASGTVNVCELAERFAVTPSTIRRDLARLDGAGKLTRTFGGAIPAVARQEQTLQQRLGDAHEAKIAMAKIARAKVKPGDRVFLDAGSSVGALAHELRGFQSLSIATVSLMSITELLDAEGIEIECLGGRLRRMSEGFVGTLAEAAVERMTFDSAFLGADGVSARLGLCEADPAQTRLKEMVAERAGNVYVMADASKVGEAPFHSWAKLPRQWTLITDETAGEAALAPFRAAGVEILVAPIRNDLA